MPVLLTSAPRITPWIFLFFRDSIFAKAVWWSWAKPFSSRSHRSLCPTKTSKRRSSLSHTVICSKFACCSVLFHKLLRSLKIKTSIEINYTCGFCSTVLHYATLMGKYFFNMQVLFVFHKLYHMFYIYLHLEISIAQSTSKLKLKWHSQPHMLILYVTHRNY